MSLRPPSTSPSPSPGPGNTNGTSKTSARASMGPSSRPAPINLNPPASPRPGGGRPTSELLTGAGMFQTPEAEAIDQWFENLQNYEATLEEMAAASLDVNFKEELSAIEQWFRVLSEAERTAALYSLLQHSTQVQIRFFITVLQQMARADPMTALLSPAAGGSMQSQMEAKLAHMGLKSPALKSGVPGSPSSRTFGANATNRQSLALDASSLLSPDSANVAPGSNDAAATLAQQRAKLKANAAHRISAPALASATADGSRNVWQAPTGLSQVAERSSDGPGQELTVPSAGPPSSRPKSMDFSSLATSLRSPRLTNEADTLESQLSPMVSGNWASMVNTPVNNLFEPNAPGQSQNLDAAAAKLANWQIGDVNGSRLNLDDPKKFRRPSRLGQTSETSSNVSANNAVYDNDGNLIAGGGAQAGTQRNGTRNVNGNFPGGWNGVGGTLRSPALSSNSGRLGGDEGVGMNMNGLNAASFGMGMPSPGLGVGMAGLAGMGQLNPFMLNMANLGAMGLSPEAQLLAAQMAANGFVQPGMGVGLGAGAFGMGMGQPGMNGRTGNRGPGNRSASGKSNNGRSEGGGKDKEEDVDPKLLEDVPAWLRSLRLHKYTPNFEGMNWRDMVVLDEAQLEAKGVAALGARRKMLKTFEQVRAKLGIEAPGGDTGGQDGL